MFRLTLLSHHLYVLCLLQRLNGGQNYKNKTKVGIKQIFPLVAEMHEESWKLCSNWSVFLSGKVAHIELIVLYMHIHPPFALEPVPCSHKWKQNKWFM